jgi:hypothetical protein
MAKPFVVVIPHQLGRAEARRRLRTGFDELKARYADKVTSVHDTWTEDHLDLDVKALGQAIFAAIDVGDEDVRVEVKLPWLLAMVAEKAKGLISQEGSRLLIEKK